jgi:hypothetical protein
MFTARLANSQPTERESLMPTKQVTIMGVMTWDDPAPSVPVYPTHPIAPGGPPPGIWPSPGHPAHPIAPGGPPVGIWPSPGVPTHPIAGPPPGIWPSPGHPAHPIAPGGQPPHVDNTLPPVLGIWPDPGVPSHPIVLPPQWAPPGSAPIQPIAGIPVGDHFLAFNVPGYGWVLVYVGGELKPDHTLPGDLPTTSA